MMYFSLFVCLIWIYDIYRYCKTPKALKSLQEMPKYLRQMKIAVYADDKDYNDIKNYLAKSKILRANNIHKIDNDNIDSKIQYDVLIVNYDTHKSHLDTLNTHINIETILLIYCVKIEDLDCCDILKLTKCHKCTYTGYYGIALFSRLMHDIALCGLSNFTRGKW